MQKIETQKKKADFLNIEKFHDVLEKLVKTYFELLSHIKVDF